MDEVVLKAMAKWPDVPAVYGWLGLDARGRWRLRGEVIPHAPSVAFINRNYAVDPLGCWYFQNGPQRVYVSLEYTPWIVRLEADDRLSTHTGLSVSAPRAAYVDDEGNLLLETEHGIALVEDRDLERVSEGLNLASGDAADPDQVAVVLEGTGDTDALRLRVAGATLELERIRRDEVAERFGFDPKPSEPAQKR